MNHALRELFNNPWIKKLSGPSLVASALAAIIHPILTGVGFEMSAAIAALGQVGFKIAAELLPTLVEAGKKGIEALADWFERAISEKPEVNEAAARTLVEQAGQVSEALQETHPDDKGEIADAVQDGLKAYGGATAEIAEQYNVAMKNVAELNQMIEQMKMKLDEWASQTIEAKRGSMIRDVEMRIKGRGGKQEIRAEDDSSISGVKQTIE
jgi:hypothetical protein